MADTRDLSSESGDGERLDRQVARLRDDERDDWLSIARRTHRDHGALRLLYERGRGGPTIDELIASVPDLSATSTSKFNPLREHLSGLAGMDSSDVYVAYSSRPGNAKVRLEQSGQQNRVRLGVLVLGDPTQLQASRNAVVALLGQGRMEGVAFIAEVDRTWQLIGIAATPLSTLPEVLGFADDEVILTPIAGSSTDSQQWLRERFDQWRTEVDYPSDDDANHQGYREEFARELLDVGRLADGVIDVAEFRRFAVGNYGGPGSQSHVNRFLRDHGVEAERQLARALHYVLAGPGSESDRVTAVLTQPNLRVPGLGESLVTKALAVKFPERWLPLFVYKSGSGVGKQDFIRTLRLEPLDEDGKSVGELAVESNHRIRAVVEPLLPGDPWGQASFLWWLRGWTTTSSLAEELLLPQVWLDEIEALTEDKPQIIFYGPPGTGKTFVARRLARSWADADNVTVVQFHPSYSYEDFVQGFRPRQSDAGPAFDLVSGPLLALAERARTTGQRCVLIIDEINRANIAKVFGELYYLLEYRNDSMRLQYGDMFALPENLVIVGTMNTADRSIALVDAALRRRFHFVPFFPDGPPLQGLLRRWLDANHPAMSWLAAVVDLANEMLGDRHMQIGPAHFMRDDMDETLADRIWRYSVLPYVEEFYFDDPERVEAFELERLRVAAASLPDSPHETDAADSD